MGFGALGPIPWDAIDRYATRHGFSEDERDEFETLVRAWDAEFLSCQREKKET